MDRLACSGAWLILKHLLATWPGREHTGHILFTECSAAAVGLCCPGRLSVPLVASEPQLPAPYDWERSSRSISFCRKSNRNLRSFSWVSPSRDHSSCKSGGKRDKTTGVSTTPYWSPLMPKASKLRMCAIITWYDGFLPPVRCISAPGTTLFGPVVC